MDSTSSVMNLNKKSRLVLSSSISAVNCIYKCLEFVFITFCIYLCYYRGSGSIKSIVQGDPNQNLLIQFALSLKQIVSDPMLVKPKCVWEVTVFLKNCIQTAEKLIIFLKIKKPATSKTHFGSEMHIFRGAASWNQKFWFGHPVFLKKILYFVAQQLLKINFHLNLHPPVSSSNGYVIDKNIFSHYHNFIQILRPHYTIGFRQM